MRNTKRNADSAPDEKKVWRGISASQVNPDPALMMPNGIYFLAIEELQGAYIDGVWEEAGWDEDDKEVPRARRYVLKRFAGTTGKVENAFANSYAGPRKYQK